MTANEGRRPVAFGTTLNRELLPLKVPSNRFGNELGLRGAPNRGPGCYDNAEVSGFIYELERRPVCKRGYSVGARTAPRFPKPSHMDIPGPPTYQGIISKPILFEEAFKSYNMVVLQGFLQLIRKKIAKQKGMKEVIYNRKEAYLGTKELHVAIILIKDYEAHPGPGSYEFDAKRDRKVKFHGSFGGPQTLITSVRIKCNEFGETDICKSCKTAPVGDYYEYKKVHFCRKCYEHHLTTGEKYSKSYLRSFYKVRDCSNIHHHEGTNAKLMLKTERDLKKQRFREAYMSLYF